MTVVHLAGLLLFVSCYRIFTLTSIFLMTRRDSIQGPGAACDHVNFKSANGTRHAPIKASKPNADEIAAAKSLQYLGYICTSIATFWTYDYICSLHEEWTFLRQSRWTKVKVLYIIARYVPFLFVITDIFLNFAPNEDTRKCKILVYIYSSFGVISLACSECFFVLRTYALWNSNKIVLVAMLSALFAVMASFIGICFSAIVTSYVTTSAVPGITGCYRSSTRVQFFLPFLLLFSFQLGLVSLTLIRAVQTWRTSNSDIYAILVKHNIFYYACGLFLSAANVLAPIIFSDVRKRPYTGRYVTDIPHTQAVYYSLLEDLEAFVLALLATRMHLHLWHIDRYVYSSEIFACISMSDMSSASADRTVITIFMINHENSCALQYVLGFHPTALTLFTNNKLIDEIGSCGSLVDESAFSFTIAVFPFTAMVLCDNQNFRPHQGVMAMTTRDAMPQGTIYADQTNFVSWTEGRQGSSFRLDLNTGQTRSGAIDSSRLARWKAECVGVRNAAYPIASRIMLGGNSNLNWAGRRRGLMSSWGSATELNTEVLDHTKKRCLKKNSLTNPYLAPVGGALQPLGRNTALSAISLNQINDQTFNVQRRTAVNMPRVQRRKHNYRDILTLHSILASTLAVSKRSQHNFEQVFSPEHEDFDDEANQRISRFFHGTSMGLCALSLMLSGPGSRGPYNQWQKCEEFFDVSMSWPDRDFRHEYR
ncbi:hypothetical protein EV424DRAFT_1555011 [Suillus variegatus]|nr:hypothetical protein EV424DRAFT_1555011 [Suillus variegatus]